MNKSEPALQPKWRGHFTLDNRFPKGNFWEKTEAVYESLNEGVSEILKAMVLLLKKPGYLSLFLAPYQENKWT